MTLKPIRQLVFGPFARRNSHDSGFHFIGIRKRLDPVRGKKDKRCQGSGTLVAVNKGVILRDVERVCRCHGCQTSVQESPAKLLLRHEDSGLKQSAVSQTGCSTLVLNGVGVDGENIVMSQEAQSQSSGYSAKRFSIPL